MGHLLYTLHFIYIIIFYWRIIALQHRVSLCGTTKWISCRVHIFPPSCTLLPSLHITFQFSSVQSLSHVWLFATPWIAACQASLSTTNSWSSLKLTSIESVMPSSHLILCCPLLLLPPSLSASESFPMSQLFVWGGQSTGVSTLASFLPKNTKDQSPLEWTGWITH